MLVVDVQNLKYGYFQVDGMIVSRGALESKGVNKGLIYNHNNNVVGSSSSNSNNTLGRGSVVSLPYSNRTLLTNSSRYF